ncbi:thioredoxin family protein [Streptomyces sp. NBC_00273]|uniref:thioredoxin family protein n=1 Tax=Streptomyces sp. NBC_00273 TaxID=2903644 RepID=UPI002E283326|nr:thioredoxin domain-containing protein [Streptomyces sp. NBC_00273]
MSSDLIRDVTDATFEAEVLKAEGPVLVEFWADWKEQSKAMAPVLDDAAATHQGKLTVAKINIDDNQETPARHGVSSIPTLLLHLRG